MRFDAVALGCLAGAGLTLCPCPGRTWDRIATATALVGAGWLGFVCVGADIGTLVTRPMLFSVTSLAATAIVVAATRETILSRPREQSGSGRSPTGSISTT